MFMLIWRWLRQPGEASPQQKLHPGGLPWPQPPLSPSELNPSTKMFLSHFWSFDKNCVIRNFEVFVGEIMKNFGFHKNFSKIHAKVTNIFAKTMLWNESLQRKIFMIFSLHCLCSDLKISKSGTIFNIQSGYWRSTKGLNEVDYSLVIHSFWTPCVDLIKSR